MSESRTEWLNRMTDIHGLDAEDIIEIVEIFFDMFDENIALLPGLYDSGDISEVVRIIHGIKGAAANIGFEDVSEKAAVLERQGNENNITELTVQLNDIIDLVDSRKDLVAM